MRQKKVKKLPRHQTRYAGSHLLKSEQISAFGWSYNSVFQEKLQDFFYSYSWVESNFSKNNDCLQI